MIKDPFYMLTVKKETQPFETNDGHLPTDFERSVSLESRFTPIEPNFSWVIIIFQNKAFYQPQTIFTPSSTFNKTLYATKNFYQFFFDGFRWVEIWKCTHFEPLKSPFKIELIRCADREQ
jgi:hypothetical protein